MRCGSLSTFENLAVSAGTDAPVAECRRPLPATVAFGPETPGWGSWDWVGHDLLEELSASFRTVCYGWNEVPDCDILFIIKHPLAAACWEHIPARTRIVYCPIDHYGSAAEIDADAAWLRRCDRVLIHCERLRRYFSPYATVESIDHHVKFVGSAAAAYRTTGPILWVGVRSNLPALVEWVNSHTLRDELLVLTNLEVPTVIPRPSDFRFDSGVNVRVENWTPQRHIAALGEARAALDIKGDDFRSRHKPPAKAIDFIAAGLPLAMNADSSSSEHLARLGFEIAVPDDRERWLSPDYWRETGRFGRVLRKLLSRERIGRRVARIIDELIGEGDAVGVVERKTGALN